MGAPQLLALVFWPWSELADFEVAALALGAALAAAAAGVLAAKHFHLQGFKWIAALAGAASITISLGPSVLLAGWLGIGLCAVTAWLLCLVLASILALGLAVARRISRTNA